MNGRSLNVARGVGEDGYKEFEGCSVNTGSLRTIECLEEGSAPVNIARLMARTMSDTAQE
jgi:hypothetical protein